MITESADKLYRAAIGVQKIRDVNRIVRVHRPKLSAFFRSQKALVLEKFKGYQFLFTESYRALREEIRPNELLTVNDWNGLWNDIDRDTFDQLQDIIAGIEGDGVLAGGLQMRNMINPAGKFWDLANPRAVQWFAQNGGSIQYIRGINETTSKQMRTLITKAIDKGWTYTQTAKEISNTFDDMSRDRAKWIAVNEATHAYENGNMMFAQSIQDDGVKMTKAWNTSEDEKVCDVCNDNKAAGYIPLDRAFPSGHQVPPAHMRDRCYLTYQAATA
jgi:hypothetical protein